jgi:hypothetical protein
MMANSFIKLGLPVEEEHLENVNEEESDDETKTPTKDVVEEKADEAPEKEAK